MCARRQNKGFTLPEAVTALMILALIASSVIVVINRGVESAADSAMRLQAFGVARDNMEKLLAASSVVETTQFGTSETNPSINWQTTVEMFYEPTSSRAWARAVCTAQYVDVSGETQKVELTNWLTSLTKDQLIEIIQKKTKSATKAEASDTAGNLQTADEAANYAGVDVNTIGKWVKNGMPLTPEGYYTKGQLDLYKMTNGKSLPAENAGLDEIAKFLKESSIGAAMGAKETDEPALPLGPDGTPDLKSMSVEQLLQYARQLSNQQVSELKND